MKILQCNGPLLNTEIKATIKFSLFKRERQENIPHTMNLSMLETAIWRVRQEWQTNSTRI